MKAEQQFQKRLLKWFEEHGRHDLPWQKNQTPYRVWVSEIMLQQTQVSTVIPYFKKFMRSFPTVDALANAEIDEVLSHWTGLGYYARARNLHKAACIIHAKFNNIFPLTVDELCELPGIGESTAGAILSLASKVRAPILDGNVKRVLTRHFEVEGWYGKSDVAERLWKLSNLHTPLKRVGDYNQAMMDLGATLCTRTKPRCSDCPLKKTCLAYEHGTQSQYPTPKKLSKQPKRMTRFLILRNHQGHILLERRPEFGIWGGLWSLPECSLDEDLSLFCRNTFGFSSRSFNVLDSFSHQFSHFELEVHPVLFELKSKQNVLMESKEQIWYKLEDKAPGGMPAPVLKLLKNLEQA